MNIVLKKGHSYPLTRNMRLIYYNISAVECQVFINSLGIIPFKASPNALALGEVARHFSAVTEGAAYELAQVIMFQ